MSQYAQTIPVFTQMLATLSAQLDKAKAHAEANGASADEMMLARLADDMHPLAQQVRFVCDQSQQTVRRLADTETPGTQSADTFDALKTLIADTDAFLKTVKADNMDGEPDRMVGFDLPNGMAFDMTAFEYVRDWALPQFYFHLTAAYMIMRHKGVELGKADFVSYMFKYARQPAS